MEIEITSFMGFANNEELQGKRRITLYYLQFDLTWIQLTLQNSLLNKSAILFLLTSNFILPKRGSNLLLKIRRPLKVALLQSFPVNIIIFILTKNAKDQREKRFISGTEERHKRRTQTCHMLLLAPTL